MCAFLLNSFAFLCLSKIKICTIIRERLYTGEKEREKGMRGRGKRERELAVRALKSYTLEFSTT